MIGCRWLGRVVVVVVAAVVCGCLGTDTPPMEGNVSAANLTVGNVTTSSSPLSKVVKYGPAISAGGSHCLALCENGTVIAWETANDGNAYGQCNIPPGLTNVTAIAAGMFHSVALRENGSAVAWGGCLSAE